MGRSSRLGIGRPHDRHAVRVFAFSSVEIIGPVQTEERRDGVVRQSLQEHHAPSQRRGRDADRADRMSGVMLAIAKGALPVFPGFPPVHRREPDQKGMRGKLLHEQAVGLL